MKQFYILSLLAVSLCITLPIQAQQSDNHSPKVVVIKKTKDKNGEITVEKIVTTKGDSRAVLDDMDTENIQSIEVIKLNEVDAPGEVHVTVEVDSDETGDVIRVNRDGEVQVIELAPGDKLNEAQNEFLEGQNIFIRRAGEKGDHAKDGEKAHGYKYSYKYNYNYENDGDGHAKARVHREHSNCVALGVFVHSQNGGAKVSGIIDGSGAKDAGLDGGDLIRAINEDEVTSVRALHVALGKYEPGDVVKVTYERDGQTSSAQTELRHWGELPDYKESWRAKVVCGDENYQEEFNFLDQPEVKRRVIIIKKGSGAAEIEEPVEEVTEDVPVEKASMEATAFDYQLSLDNFTVFPNPSSGKFRVQFEAEDKPLTVSIFDGSGREIFRDNMSDFNGFYNKEIDLTNLAKGTLVLSIAQEGKRYSDVIILQ